MDFVRVVAAVVVSVALPIRLDASRRWMAATTADTMAGGLAAIRLVLAVITVLVAVTNLKTRLHVE